MSRRTNIAELAFRADLTLTLVSGAAELAARSLPPEPCDSVVATLNSLDRRLDRWLRRLAEVDDASFRRVQLHRLVRDSRRLLQLAVRLPIAYPSPTTPMNELVADAQRAVDAYVRACMAELRDRARASGKHV